MRIAMALEKEATQQAIQTSLEEASSAGQGRKPPPQPLQLTVPAGARVAAITGPNTGVCALVCNRSHECLLVLSAEELDACDLTRENALASRYCSEVLIIRGSGWRACVLTSPHSQPLSASRSSLSSADWPESVCAVFQLGAAQPFICVHA